MELKQKLKHEVISDRAIILLFIFMNYFLSSKKYRSHYAIKKHEIQFIFFCNNLLKTIYYNNLIPLDIMNWQSLFTLKGFLIMVFGGFLVGFGTRYAGGCTSGHAIMGLSNLQLPSLIATISFMIGGFIMANLLLPLILSL